MVVMIRLILASKPATRREMDSRPVMRRNIQMILELMKLHYQPGQSSRTGIGLQSSASLTPRK